MAGAVNVCAAVCALAFALAFGACRPSDAERRAIRFTLPADGFASIHIKDAGSRVVRTLATAQPFAKGAHELAWNGLDDKGQPAPPGEYTWSGAIHTGIRAKLRGWACADFGTPWRVDGVQQWGGDAGVPSAVAADGERVYLGWSGAESGTSVLACDLDGRPIWGWRDRRKDSVTGVKTLAVDGGIVTVLGGGGGAEATGSELFRLDARDGTPIPWLENRELTIASLWPADAKTKPDRADGMAARAGRIYLTFTEAQFLAVLDAQTGAYLQTVVGAPPELIDVVPTKTESPDKPGELMAADFALVSLRGGVLGKVLFAHDPLWVVTSEMQPLDREERLTALSVIGDGAKVHQHSVFVGLGAPFQQVQRRAILDTEGFLWSAGRAGGRQIGPWVPEALGPIRGVALDARGRLWVAEGDDTPPRFSVWETDGNDGRLVREFFGQWRELFQEAAILPTNPEIFVAGGCEWRVDHHSGAARCLGVVTTDGAFQPRFHKTSEGQIDLKVIQRDGLVARFVRREDGTYELAARAADTDFAMAPAIEGGLDGFHCGQAKLSAEIGVIRFIVRQGTVNLVNADDLTIAHIFAPALLADDRGTGFTSPTPKPILGTDLTHVYAGAFPQVTQFKDGKVFAAAMDFGVWTMEITGLDTLRPLPGGKMTIPANSR